MLLSEGDSLLVVQWHQPDQVLRRRKLDGPETSGSKSNPPPPTSLQFAKC